MPTSRVRLAVVLWLLAMVGVACVTFTIVPQLLARHPARIPFWLALSVSFVQSAALAALAVWAGVAWSARLGLGAPTLQALLSDGDALASLRRQTLPALATGALCGVFLIYLVYSAPSALQRATQALDIPLVAKLLYGGVTEEILMRWGLMTALLGLVWRFGQRSRGTPQPVFAAVAVVAAALLFGLGHLPAAVALGVEPAPDVIAFVVLGNTLPGIVFGWLYYRYGLEAAMIAHAAAHLVAA